MSVLWHLSFYEIALLFMVDFKAQHYPAYKYVLGITLLVNNIPYSQQEFMQGALHSMQTNREITSAHQSHA